MTLGTNASIQEQIEYAPHEINFDFLIEELEELELYRELLNDDEYSSQDLKERIEDYEAQIKEKDEQTAKLYEENDRLDEEIFDLKQRIDELEEETNDQGA